eukprot:1235117-Rhodomonas_salina.1
MSQQQRERRRTVRHASNAPSCPDKSDCWSVKVSLAGGLNAGAACTCTWRSDPALDSQQSKTKTL